MSSEARVCAACGFEAPPESRFCPQCGRPLDGATGGAPRRLYGVLSPEAALALSGLLLLAAILAFIAGSAVPGIVFLALAGVAFVFFLDAARRNPENPLARRVTTTGDHIRGWTRFGRESSAAWTRAMRDVVRFRSESRTLRREREQVIRSLGDAAYREDEPAVSALRARVREIDEALAERDRAEAESLARARQQVEEERAASRPTQQHSVDELTSKGDRET